MLLLYFNRIRRLSLKDNCLSDAGIAKLTLPCRMFGASLTWLVSLDLSLNPAITDKTIKYLVKLTCLEKVNLSGSKVTVPGGVRRLQEIRDLCLTRQASTSTLLCSIYSLTNKGF